MISSFIELKTWFSSPYEFLDKKALTLGNTFYLNLPGMRDVLVSGDPSIVDAISKNQYLIGGIGSQFLHHLVGPSVITQYGAEHTASRKKLNPIFLQNIDKDLIESLTHKNTLKFLDHLRKGESLSITDWAGLVTLSTIIDYLLGDVEEICKTELFDIVNNWKKSISNSAYFFLRPMQINYSKNFGWGKFIFHRNKLHAFIKNLINRRSQNLGLLSKIIHEFNWSDDQILYEFISILMFGHDTSAILIGWWTRHILTYYKWDRDLTIPLVESSLKETTRITPPVVHLTRVAAEDLEICSYKIKKNQKVFPCIYLSHMNEEYFPNPKIFKLERFENKNFPASVYYPFGFGDRICVGKKFAEIQTLEIAKLLLAHKKISLSKNDVPPVRQFFLMVPEHGTMVNIN